MTAKRNLTMYCTPARKRKLQALAKRSGCSMDFFIEACFHFAIYHFDGKITEVLKLLLQQDAKPTKEKHSVPLTVRLAPEVYEGIRLFVGAILRLFCDRRRLLLENLALRQQLAALPRVR
jgi:hypothetical protein